VGPQKIGEYVNGNGIKRWHLGLSFLIALLALGNSFFYPSSNGVKVEEHLRYIDARLDKYDSDLARKDVLYSRFEQYDKQLTRQEDTIREQTKALEQLQAQLARSRRN
jgi:hypothetical protein